MYIRCLNCQFSNVKQINLTDIWIHGWKPCVTDMVIFSYTLLLRFLFTSA